MPFVVNLASENENISDYIYDPQRLNRYTYCLNNPVNAIDPDGKDVQFLIGGPYSGHNYGHVALRVIGTGYDFTFDYGRYGKTWGIGESEGEGMLRVWSNFSNYIESENATGRTTTGYYFKTTTDQDRTVTDYYQSLIKDNKSNLSRKTMEQYKIRDYNAKNFNCVTISEEGFSKAFPEISFSNSEYNTGRGMSFSEKMAAKITGWPRTIFMPLDLGAFLENSENDYSYERSNYSDKEEE